MLDLTFAEQVKIILNRRGMTIKRLAELIEEQTGKKMSRQNLTQRLNRDNFQEQDMREIARILGCPFQMSILGEEEDVLPEERPSDSVVNPVHERDITVGEILDIEEAAAKQDGPSIEELLAEMDAIEQENKEQMLLKERRQELKKEQEENEKKQGNWKDHLPFHRRDAQKDVNGKVQKEPEEIIGEINPYTGKEYATNSVRMHPTRIGYVQVYSQKDHKWTDMTEWAFLGYQERRKALLGKKYEPPVYMD